MDEIKHRQSLTVSEKLKMLIQAKQIQNHAMARKFDVSESSSQDKKKKETCFSTK